MTETGSGIPPNIQTIKVRDRIGPLAFQGQMIADVSWTYEEAAESGNDRWTNITLYRVHEGTTPYKYVIQVIGRSVIYHLADGPCGKGVRMKVGLLSAASDQERYDALRPCGVRGCNPLDLEDLSPDDTVAVEVDRPTLHKCADADQVVRVLYAAGPPSHNGGEPKDFSWLNMRLLTAASSVDPDIEAALTGVRQL